MKDIKTVPNPCSSPHPSCKAPPGCHSAAGNTPVAPPPSPGGTSTGLSSVAGGSRGNLWGHPQTHSVSRSICSRHALDEDARSLFTGFLAASGHKLTRYLGIRTAGIITRNVLQQYNVLLQ